MRSIRVEFCEILFLTKVQNIDVEVLIFSQIFSTLAISLTPSRCCQQPLFDTSDDQTTTICRPPHSLSPSCSFFKPQIDHELHTPTWSFVKSTPPTLVVVTARNMTIANAYKHRKNIKYLSQSNIDVASYVGKTASG